MATRPSESEDKPTSNPKKNPKKATQAKAEVIQSLKVEINFPAIHDLKLPIAFDSDGNLIIGVQFKARVDQFEIARLVNLLKQPHGTLYAMIGSAQSAMDFKFDAKGLRFEIFKASKEIADKKPPELTTGKDEPAQDKTAAQVEDMTDKAVKITDVRFNHIPEEKLKFGVFIEYAVNGGELKSAAGRGKNPTEAVIAGVKQCGAVDKDLKEPFEIRAALELLEPSPANYQLIRVLDVGSFDVDTAADGGSEEQPKGD